MTVSKGLRSNPPHPPGAPFGNSLLQNAPDRNSFLGSDIDPAVGSTRSRKPGQGGESEGFGSSIGSVPSSPPKGGLGKITPSKGKP